MAKWMVYQKKEDFRAIAQACGISQVLARLIRNRDVIGIEETERFLRGICRIIMIRVCFRTWTRQLLSSAVKYAGARLYA